ncbi:di-N-acetylchitobiase-like [Scyliorhinus canicula]|uniref:di-N-acetylchitobiase-like n=1 Tax=Scyliorhinus canicula TaxID=7830 RepID=UPI0018F312B0|nr:di-N-acetylchitobiase-like [Scyliorhinus canicula]
MRWSLALAQFVAVLVMWIGGASEAGFLSNCPCSTPRLCGSLPADHQFPMEVLVFDSGGADWKYYDWSKVTTIVAFGRYDRELLCHAHANNVRVVLKATIPQHNLLNRNKRTVWIKKKISLARRQFMDGINMGIWETDAPGSEYSRALSELVEEATQIFHREIPGSQVTFNVPWSPDCIVGRCYDYAAIANSCDFLFVMSYDIHRRKLGNCFARPNAPYNQTLSGLSAYINLGIDSRKLVMGVPWYGYDYTCQRFLEPGRCELETFHFRKPTCNFRASRWIPYKEIMKHLPKSISGRYWDDDHEAPYYIYMVNNTHHEVWYDDPESISIKSSILKKLKLRGIGVWIGNFLNYSKNPEAAMQTGDMWDALRVN